jgi:hypothetical protein
MYLKFDNNPDVISFCLNIILKESKKEDRLVKQIFYTMASAYTNNPINLAINSPAGEGKTRVLQKVGEKFPKEDVMFLAGMTDKALFHRQGVLVIKNEQGEYEPIDNIIAQIDSEIEDKESEIQTTKDRNLKQGLRNIIKELEEKKKDLLKDAKKLIDLSHKILVFLDSPRPELFNALMPLLSHDRYEVEYEFVDTNSHNGIKTKSNVLRGWPAVIFAQAIDYSHYARYPEIQRRFIITNPKMTSDKYAEAVDLTGEKFGLPDFAYQEKVVSDMEKEKVKEIIKGIKQRMLEVCQSIEAGKNNVIIPFYEALTNSLPKEKAFDMTIANRLFGFLSLLPLINMDKRPRIVLRKKGEPKIQSIPFALFEDLQEAIFLMQYANGVRPYVLEWYYDVFLEAYNAKTEPDSKVNNTNAGIITEEKRIALTTEQLVDKTKEVYNRTYTTKQILETYVNPLINQGYVDKTDSILDKRSNIYYPVIVTTKNRKLFETEQMNNLSQQTRVNVKDYALYPNKQCLISKIQQVLAYSADKGFVEEVTKIKSHEDNKEITVEELVERYYKDPENYFELDDSNSKSEKPPSDSTPTSGLIAEENRSKENEKEEYRIGGNDSNNSNLIQKDVSDDYLRKAEIARESQENAFIYTKPIEPAQNPANKLFEENKSNNFLYSCYYCNNLQVDNERDYEHHVVVNHPNKLAYPSKADLERLGIQGKTKSWEI